MALDRKCERCGAPFQAFPYAVARGEGRFCSHSCAARHRSEGRPTLESMAQEAERERLLGQNAKLREACRAAYDTILPMANQIICPRDSHLRRVADALRAALGEEEER